MTTLKFLSLVTEREIARIMGTSTVNVASCPTTLNARNRIHQMELTRLIVVVLVGVTYLPTYLLLVALVVILQVFVNPIGNCKKVMKS